MATIARAGLDQGLEHPLGCSRSTDPQVLEPSSAAFLCKSTGSRIEGETAGTQIGPIWDDDSSTGGNLSCQTPQI